MAGDRSDSGNHRAALRTFDRLRCDNLDSRSDTAPQGREKKAGGTERGARGKSEE